MRRVAIIYGLTGLVLAALDTLIWAQLLSKHRPQRGPGRQGLLALLFIDGVLLWPVLVWRHVRHGPDRFTSPGSGTSPRSCG